ncbi:collagen-like protein [[Muricauda] lutisoli]|uniref:Collagen-like protein n=1 Tax=[Muricauda] lutisoli TaxID=2816035 RepID=A0ABS3EXR9_9FLAO|nr:collagen-like protein [[Muricauda] lutisoli]MBO0331049.1 collagen-like protein [[Muricauda] lutisoli]
MKTLKFLSMAIMCMAMVLVSCTGDKGETGPQGEQGIAGVDGANGSDGVDGADGASCWDLNGNGVGDADEDINDDGNFDALDCQGTDGVDGNANVQIFDIDVTDSSGSSLLFNIPIDPAALPNYAMLFYLKNLGGLVYSVPGPMDGNNYYSRLYYDENDSTGTIRFYNNSDDTAYNVAAGYFTNLRIIAIETTTGAKNGQQSIMDELKAAGIDADDYDAVAEYFGLDK